MLIEVWKVCGIMVPLTYPICHDDTDVGIADKVHTMPSLSTNISEIRVDSVLKTNPHVDGGWFWSKYSVNPYLGCSYGCAYCFLRQRNYGLAPKPVKSADFIDAFAQNIQVKINAAEVLDRELDQVPPDVIIAGDYQPIDSRYRISRQLLQVCLDHGFPTMIIAKSPTVLRDLDLIQSIGERSWACVVFSIAFSESGPQQTVLEPAASSIESRFRAMQKLREAGVYTGTAMMPIMPFLNDTEDNLRAIVAQTERHGGQFVLAGGMVLGDGLETQLFPVLKQIDEALPMRYQQLYQGGFSPHDHSWSQLGRKVRKLCNEHGLAHRIQRYIAPGPLAINKRIAEKLLLKVYEMELSNAAENEILEMRKLAWQVEESPSRWTRDFPSPRTKAPEDTELEE